MVLGCNSIIRCYACHVLNLFMINKKLSSDIVKNFEVGFPSLLNSPLLLLKIPLSVLLLLLLLLL